MNDYHMTMEDIGVAELKARLSEYLRAVRKGGEIVVHDRDQPIARIIPYTPRSALIVREPTSPYATLGDIPLPVPIALEHDPVVLLLEDRQRER